MILIPMTFYVILSVRLAMLDAKPLLFTQEKWLKGLSPKQNREIPELNYDRVYD